MQKENPNPVIHSTHKRSHPSSSSTAPLLGAGPIHRYNLGGSSSPTSPADEWNAAITTDEDPTLPRWGSVTAEERSVALALSAAAYPSPESTSDDKSLDILQQSGFALYHPQHIQKQCKAVRYPSYAPSDPDSYDSTVGVNKQIRDAITANEVFDIVRNIQDPEHPLTLEQLNVVRLELIDVVDLEGGSANNDDSCNQKKFSTVHVQFTPTIPHCSMATLIGLSLRVKLLRSLPSRFKVVVNIESGTHVSEHAVNKQLADKERVRAALENEHLLGVVNRCISGGMQMQ